MREIYTTKTVGADMTEALGKKIACALETAGIERAFIAMRGEMGVGKTAFTRGFAAHFDIKNVKSPTYALLCEYRGKANLYHFDMYRIESEDDLLSIGYDDYLERRGYVICEWSENIDDFLPENVLFVSIKRDTGADDARIISVCATGADFDNFEIS